MTEVKITKLPPGEAEGARDLQQWSIGRRTQLCKGRWGKVRKRKRKQSSGKTVGLLAAEARYHGVQASAAVVQEKSRKT